MRAPTVAVTSTLAMVRAAEALDVDAAQVLSRAGVSMATLRDPDARIPIPLCLEIWDELREKSGNHALQLAAPRALPVGAYRLLDHLVGASETVGDGVRRFARFFGIVNPAVALKVSQDHQGAALVAALAAGGPVPGVYVDYIFAALVGRVRAFFRPQLRLNGVDFQHGAPEDTRAYQEAFGSVVRFNADADRLTFSVDEWAARLETSDPTLAQILEARARLRLESAAETSPLGVSEIRRAIVRALPEGARIEDVTRTLHTSVRSLQRKLAESGTSYRAVVDTLRSDLSREYLVDDTVSICEVALLLGFSDQRSFHRAFVRWTGQSPGRWRGSQRRSTDR